MIKRIRLRNFQIHDKLSIDLDKITTIVGESDRGKSSIVRGLYWAAFNNPSGDAFIRTGTKGCSAIVETGDHLVKRRRGKGVNDYTVDGKELKALGKSGVPDDVQDALMLSRLNFQLQHDSPLWLSDSPGQVAKNLNEIVNLDLIDRVLSNLNKQVRRVSQDVDNSNARLIKAKKQVQDIEWVEDADEDLSAIEKLESRIEDLSEESDSLEQAVQSIEDYQGQVNELGDKAAHARSMCMIADQIQDIEQDESEINSLLGTIASEEDKVHQLAHQLADVRSELSQVKVCPICERPL